MVEEREQAVPEPGEKDRGGLAETGRNVNQLGFTRVPVSQPLCLRFILLLVPTRQAALVFVGRAPARAHFEEFPKIHLASDSPDFDFDCSRSAPFFNRWQSNFDLRSVASARPLEACFLKGRRYYYIHEVHD